MVKIANNVSVLGHLRDIRVSSYKVLGRNTGGGGQGGNANPGSQRSGGDTSEEMQRREQSGYERGVRETEERCARQAEQLKAEWEVAHRNDAVRLLQELNNGVNHQVGEMFKSLEKHMVMLAAEAAIRLTSGIPMSADMVEAYVRESINLVEQDTEITVVLNPEDLLLLEQHQSSLLNRVGNASVVRFRGDAKITRGGCLVETKFGELDARKETKIELLRKAVNE